jgi:probable HAF family extracellular repeat protein
VKKFVSLCRFVVVVSLLFSGAAMAQTTYHAFIWSAATGMQDLGSLGGTSYALGINASGTVVGYYISVETEVRPFVWTQSGGMQDIGTLGGQGGVASGINDAGEVVGWANTASGQVHAFRWNAKNGMKDLGTLGGISSSATAINKLGQVTGSSTKRGNKVSHAFLWSAKTGMTDLGAPAGQTTIAFGMNDTAIVVGEFTLSTTIDHAFLRNRHTLIDLGTLFGEGESAAIAINDSEIVVGNSDDLAFMWTRAGGMQDLGPLGTNGSSADAINSLGVIVGSYELTSPTIHAAIWTAPNQIQDLGVLGGTYSTATGINDSGQVVGYSTLQ